MQAFKKISLPVILILIIFFNWDSFGQSAKKKKVGEYYEKSLNAFNKENLKLAKHYSDSALLIDEWDTKSLYLSALIYESNSEIAKAIIAYEKVTIEDPGYLEAFLAKAVLYYEQKNYKEALNNLDEIVYYDGVKETKALIFKSTSYGEGKNGVGSVGAVTTTANIDREIVYYKALIFRDLGELEKAKELFKKLIAKEKLPEYLVGLGLVYERLNFIDSAKIAYRNALTISPLDHSAAYQLQLIDPFYSVPTALSEDDDFHYALAKKAYDYYEKKKFKEALIYYNKALQIAPEIAEYYSSRGLVYEQLRKYDLAIDDFRMSLSKDSNFIVSYYRIANIHYKKKLFAEAIAEYTLYLSFVPEDADVLYNLGMAYLSTKQYRKACQALEKAKEMGKSGTGDVFAKFCTE